MLTDRLKQHIREVPDFPVTGVNFKDITGLLSDQDVFNEVIFSLSRSIKYKRINCIVSPDARGWLFAAPVAYELRLPLYIVRKAGKLPPEVTSIKYDYEYASDTLEMPALYNFKNKNVAIIDDVNATGNTALAIARLVKDAGAAEICYSCVIDLPFLNGSELLQANNIKTFSIMEYHG